MTFAADPIIETYVIDPGTEGSTWGDLLNTNQRRIIQAATGVLTRDVTGLTSWTLDDTDFTGTESHYKSIFLFGVMSANLEIFFPLGKQRAHRLFNFTVSNTTTPRTVTLKIVGNVGPPPNHQVVLVHNDRISFLLREDGSFWTEFQASQFMPATGAALFGPMNANNQAITNLAYPAIVNDNAASVRWVVDYVTEFIVASAAVERSRLYPVGSLYINANNPTNPGDASLLGFGFWVQYGGGTVLTCAGIHTDPNGETINFTTAVEKPNFGTLNVRLAQANLPPASIPTTNPGDNAGGFSTVEASSAGSPGTTVLPLGSGAPFLNFPPISIAYVWRRVA